MLQFNTIWKNMNQYQQYKKYTYAKQYAQNKLLKQKTKTGIAILGRPLQSLLSDDKFGNNLLLDSIAVGEQLALAALTAEILVMLVTDIKAKELYQ